MNGFEITNQIGQGAFSSVYLVKRLKDNRIYALKRVHIDQLGKKEQENAINEIRLLASINHVNIIGYKESFFDNENKSLNIIMEYADDGDLSIKIQQKKKTNDIFDEDIIWDYAIQMVRGLKALHDCKIMHRDIKTANIFLMKDGTCKLGDLNVSKVVKMGMLHTQTGTPYYASPEVWNDKSYNYKSDIWGIGCVIYELCTMRVPFKGTNMDNLYKSVCKGKYESLPQIYSKDLSQIIALLLKTNPNERPSCDQFLNHPIVLKRIIKGNLNNNNNNEMDQKANLLGTIKFRDIREIKEKLPKKNYDNFDIEDYENKEINNQNENNKQENITVSNQRILPKSISTNNSNCKNTKVKDPYTIDQTKQVQGLKSNKNPNVNKRLFTSKNEHGKSAKNISMPSSVEPIKQIHSAKGINDNNANLKRPVSSMLIKANKGYAHAFNPNYVQKASNDKKVSKQDNEPQKYKRPASANPSSIKINNIKKNQANNNNNGILDRKKDRNTNHYTNNPIPTSKNSIHTNPRNFAKRRPLSSHPIASHKNNNNNKQIQTSSNNINTKHNRNNLIDDYISNDNISQSNKKKPQKQSQNYDPIIIPKNSQKAHDPDHRMLINPIKIIEPVSNIKSYQYKVNYSSPNNNYNQSSNHQYHYNSNSQISNNINTNTNTNVIINPNSFLKRNVYIQSKTPQYSQNNPTPLLNANTIEEGLRRLDDYY